MIEMCSSVCEWCACCFNFCTGRCPTVPSEWNSLLFLVAVLHFGVPSWVLSASTLGLSDTGITSKMTYYGCLVLGWWESSKKEVRKSDSVWIFDEILLSVRY